MLPRLYPILDTESLSRKGCNEWAMVARAWISGGAKLLQLRHKADWTRDVYSRALQVAEECGRADVTLIVNDRADFAQLLGAGLHVGQEDLPPSDCRKVIGPAPMLGFSTHNSEQLFDGLRQPVDYLAFGPVFATTSKSRPDPAVHLDRLREACVAADRPLVAIGGIDLSNVCSVFDAGADSVAVISGLLPERIDESSLLERMEAWLRVTPQ